MNSQNFKVLRVLTTRIEGENTEVSEALGEQYLPKFAGDVLPKPKQVQLLPLLTV